MVEWRLKTKSSSDLCKHEDVGADSSQLRNKLSVAIPVCNPNAGERGRNKRLAGIC